jgi:hypothetical protein
MSKRALVTCLLVASGCNTVPNDENFDCAVGKLSDTWSFHYDETSGTCGPISDETGVFEPGTPSAPGCKIASQMVASDKCKVDTTFTCPTADGQAVQNWTLTLNQVGEDRLTGTGTVQVNHPTLGNCRSTYSITVTRL